MAKDNDNSQFLFNSTQPTLTHLDWRKLLPWLIGALSLCLALGLAFWLWSKFGSAPQLSTVETSPNNASSSIGGLNNKLGSSTVPVVNAPNQNETLAFGDFYTKPGANPAILAKGVTLPTNIKEQSANYYALNREIALSADQVKDFNNNGFVVIDNPFGKEAKDFFSVYKLLNQKNLPFLVTNDFLFYYYQNTLKSIFKQLESDTFYQETWAFNKAMFEIANQRYLDRYAKLGLVNDTVLEAMRLEAAYFAVSLELLKVKPNQIIPNSQASVTTKEWFKLQFTEREAATYKFTVPSYLALDVGKELALINKAKALTKPTLSPVLLYPRNYQDFVLAASYEKNHRLTNFYQALTWSSSLLPLYYQSPACPDCPLDQSDWMIHQAAAQLIARDLHVHQELKNQWAKIYKAYSYFSGLRSELTYLDYSEAFIKLFGDALEKKEGSQSAKTIEQIFDTANPERDQQLAALQSELGSRSFDPAKGGLDRSTALGRLSSGLRMVQTAYWPTEYIYDKLTFGAVGAYLDDPKQINKTTDKALCEDVNRQVIRCRGIGLDIINPIFNETINNNYFVRNTRFQNYFNQTPALRQHLNGFDNRAWHQSFFWSNLHSAQQFLNNRKLEQFNYSSTPAWSNAVLNTALGAVVNANLPYDQWRYAYQQESGLAGQELIKYNYLEPNLTLVDELLANGKMVFTAFVKLGLVKENNQEFSELFADLSAARALILKEQAGEETDFTDWSFMNNLVNKYYVVDAGDKSTSVNFRSDNSANPNKIYAMDQSLEGVKLLLSMQFHQGRNLIVAGPVFNFNERAR
jgi:hypothetical protein